MSQDHDQDYEKQCVIGMVNMDGLCGSWGQSDLEKSLYSKCEEELDQSFSMYVDGLFASGFTEMLV